MKKYLIISLLIFLPTLATAETIVLEIDTSRETVNAVEGTVRVPKGVAVEEIQTGRSAILIWIQAPVFDRESRTIAFSGFSPGGFSGKQPLFAISGELASTDLPTFAFSGVQALKNDGEGTPVSVALSARRGVDADTDTDPPEPFTLVISRSEDIFEGRAFLSFLTQDKGTGVERYEYASSWFGTPGEDKWVRSTSPKELSRRDLFKRVYVRAVDHNGNTRVASTPGSYRYASMLFGTIIILCVLSFLRRSFYSSPYPLS
jgi:hypothetical protein